MADDYSGALGRGALAPEALYRRCDDSLPFATSDELEDLEAPVGQARALEALQFGVAIRAHGYNLFVLGPSGTGRRAITQSVLHAAAARRGPAADWCYVANFADERRPVALELPAGRGPQLRRDVAALIEQLRSAAPAALDSTVTQAIEPLKRLYRDLPAVLAHADALCDDALRTLRSSLESDANMPPAAGGRRHPLARYGVNVLVDRSGTQEAPIVHESHPTVANLLGRVEHRFELGALVTDFTLIRPGALHRANGGYLVLDADRVLTEPRAWPALKRALLEREIRIEPLGEPQSLVSPESLEPQRIPLDVKVVLIGERAVYYSLCELDPDFAELFKVAADFADDIDRTPENTVLYARLIATLARRAGLPPLARGAVARVIEHGGRLLGDSRKLSARLRDIEDLLREASHFAALDGAPAAERRHVQAAIDAQVRRLDRLRAAAQEDIVRDIVLIDTAGGAIGQVNGLSVCELGAFCFGVPSRITANVRLGEGEIVDIERETELGGPIHSKGMLIVASYLAAKYAADAPLSLRASLVFEQSYTGIDGDSASVAEICALLSALAELPVRQCFAVTGSINQHGRVQVIGGVNEKIEGFYDLCVQRGLDGTHGVLIPAENAQHLMLRHDVVNAARAGRFSVYPITSIDDAVELLTGVPAGARDASGAFPAGTVNRRVEQRLQSLALTRRRFDHPPEGALDLRRRLLAARVRRDD